MSAGAHVPGVDWARRTLAGERAPVALLTAASVASVVLLLSLGSQITFLLDEWAFIVYRPDFDVGAILDPHNEHIVVLPILLYKTLIELTGIDSAMPYRVAATAVFVLSVWLLFAYVRKRVGAWPALAAASLVLFLGAAWEDLLWPFQIGLFGSMAAGLGALLALDRGTRGGDRLAAGLLVVSILCGSLGIAFVAGAFVHVLLGPGRVRRLYVPGVATAVFAAWWLGWGREAETAASLENLVTSPAYVFDSVAGSISALLGLATPRDETGVGPLDWGRPLAVLLIGLGAWRVWTLRSVSRGLAVALAVGAGFWFLAAFNELEGRPPTSSRYLYTGGILVLLIAAELLRGVRFSWRALGVVGVVTALAVVSNVSFLRQAAASYRDTSELVRAALGALEIGRDRAPAGMILTQELANTPYVHIEAGLYLEQSAEHGTPAFAPDEIRSASELAREGADKVLASALGLTFDEGADAPARGCVALDRAAPGLAEADVPAGGAVVQAGPRALELRLGRFAADSFPVPVGELEGREAGVLRIPGDDADVPWRLRADGPARLCALPEG